MTRFLMTTAAAFTLAGTAFAQDAMQDQQVEDGVEMMQDGAEMAQEGAEMVEEATDAPMMDDSMTTTVVEPAPVVLSTEPSTDMMAAEPAPEFGGDVERIEVACPEGSTAQPDGTCMLEGDALPE